MYIISLIFILFCFIKFFFYGIYEITELKNRVAGIFICTLAIIALIFPYSIILYYYII